MWCAWKLNLFMSAPGGIERNKNSVRLGRSIINISSTLANSTSKPEDHVKQPMTTRFRRISPRSCAQDYHSSKAIIFEACLPMLARQNLTKPSSLLRSRLKLNLHWKKNELLFPPRSCLCMDFVFYDVESIRGFTSVLDVFCLSDRHPQWFHAETQETTTGHNSVRRQLSWERG